MSSPISQTSKLLLPDPTTIKPSFAFTTGNFTSFALSTEALERAKKLFDSPDPSQNPKADSSFKPQNPFDSTSDILTNTSKPFESPSETTVQTKDQTEDSEKRHGKGVSVGVKAGIIRCNRGELSFGSSLQPKFVNILNSRKLNMTSLKRKPESPVQSQSQNKKMLKSQKTEPDLLQLAKYKPLKQFFASLGLLVKAENAEQFVFKCKCYTNGCNCARQGMNWEDFYDVLIEAGMKVSKDWVREHYRLVVWKYASYERRIEACEGILSVQRVLENLQKRYDLEVVQGKRSVLKRILDGDEFAHKRMVLCVGSIRNYGKNFSVELTDGWHCVFTDISVESLFYPLIQRKVFCQGLKIEVFGCTLKEGKLVLSYNTVRRAAWHRRLGDVGNVFPFPVCISSIKESGGLVGRITVYVSKIYPLLFVESGVIKSKFSSNEQNFTFFDCIVKDGIADFSNKKISSALICVKSNASEIYENLKVGKQVSFYFLLPLNNPINNKTRHVNRRNFVFNNKSKIVYGKKERKDMVKIREIVNNKTKVLKEVDVVGIVTKVEKTQNNEVSALNLAGVHGNIRVQIHNPSFFGRALNSVEVSNFKYRRFLALFNVYVESRDSPVIDIKTSNYTEIVHNNFPDRMKQQIDILSDFNLNTLLSHREECDYYGCVCGLG